MKKNIIYFVGMLAVGLAFACTKETPVAPVPAATDSFTVNGTIYSVDHKYTTPDSVNAQPTGTYRVLLVHGAITTAQPTGDYAVMVDSISTQATGSFNFHNALTTLRGTPCGAVYYNDISGSGTQMLYESLSTTGGTLTKTGSRSLTFTATVTNIFSQPQNTAQVSGTIASF